MAVVTGTLTASGRGTEITLTANQGLYICVDGPFSGSFTVSLSATSESTYFPMTLAGQDNRPTNVFTRPLVTQHVAVAPIKVAVELKSDKTNNALVYHLISS